MANPLVQQAQHQARLKHLAPLLQAVFSEPAVQLAMTRDLVPEASQADWNGCPSLPLVVTGCLAVVRRLMGWSYRVLAEEVDASVGWRWVCQLYGEPMPNYRTIQAREALLQADTLQRIHTQVLALAQAQGFTAGERLRIDSTVTETDIHHPTDSTLLADAARVLSRWIKRARYVLQPERAVARVYFRDRHRQARHLTLAIARLSRKTTPSARQTMVQRYRQLLKVVETLLAQVAFIQPGLAANRTLKARRITQALSHYTPLVAQVVQQTQRRVLHGESVPAPEKLVSLFEPHSAVIRRGKAQPHETEFGIKLWFGEVDGGLLSEYRLLKGCPNDAEQVVESLQQHRRRFGRAPQELAGDRGMYSAANEQTARRLGVRRVSLPQPGAKSAQRQRHEKQPWFRAAQRFRHGIEGRISQVRRARRLTRCLNHGWAGLERWIGWGVIANNLAVLVAKLSKPRRTKRRPNPWQ